MDNNSQNNLFQSYKDYADKDKTYKITFTKVILLLLSIAHFIWGYPYLKNIIRDNLVELTSFSDQTIEYILIGYYAFSILFIVITAWKICNTHYLLKRLYILAVIVLIGITGYFYYKDNIAIQSEASLGFLNDAKTIYENAKTQYRFEAKGFEREITYARRGGKDCSKHLTEAIDEDVNYYITFNDKGKIVRLIVVSNEYQYDYKGNGLTDLKDIDRNSHAITDKNKIEIPACPAVTDF